LNFDGTCLSRPSARSFEKSSGPRKKPSLGE
jgi:hypothetical protein